jgi:antitoxin (DNA-binding transcriptional repressor) of toxin-antitoxin stability system
VLSSTAKPKQLEQDLHRLQRELQKGRRPGQLTIRAMVDEADFDQHHDGGRNVMFNIEIAEQSKELEEGLQRLARGEEVVLTRLGQPVARLMPVQRRDRAQVEYAIRRLKEFRKGKRLGEVSIKALIDEGRP